jgi:hypothetical protein
MKYIAARNKENNKCVLLRALSTDYEIISMGELCDTNLIGDFCNVGDRITTKENTFVVNRDYQLESNSSLYTYYHP